METNLFAIIFKDRIVTWTVKRFVQYISKNTKTPERLILQDPETLDKHINLYIQQLIEHTTDECVGIVLTGQTKEEVN